MRLLASRAAAAAPPRRDAVRSRSVAEQSAATPFGHDFSQVKVVDVVNKARGADAGSQRLYRQVRPILGNPTMPFNLPPKFIGWTDLDRILKMKSTPTSMIMLTPPASQSSRIGGLGQPPISLPTSQLTGGGKESDSPLVSVTAGKFQLGLRLGFPDVDEDPALEGNPQKATELFRRAAIKEQVISGKVPTPWELADKGKLAASIWSLASSDLAPEFVRDFVESLPTKKKQPQKPYEIDAVLSVEFDSGGLKVGGGLYFKVTF